ncbi:sulfite exporter TauE/SafE family protein [Sneathiella marina]|uniref:Probable membrane transporter protein n=1 Tax=Sneathiella marina TaxID=2950108 RepID=A0ABY4W6T1_9PROT|nr:sulfite exporter TauE/SafE family protein [Sneathiella marina]USG62566.1 sulfite exporter TauE/SafE family protein [Sneathiella marina]
MEPILITLSITVFFAAALQSATGIGFGVIAGPIMLLVLNNNSSIQISIILNLLIAVLLVRSIRLEINKTILFQLLIGSVLGLPLGLLIFLNVNVVMLKLLAGAAISLTALLVIRNNIMRTRPAAAAPSKRGALVTGVASGLMSSSLAMPGPVVAAWMSATGIEKQVVRATTLTLFVFSYGAALLFQIPFAGVESTTLWTCLKLVPATIAGIYAGSLIVNWLTERVFSWLIIVILLLTAAILFASSI